MKHFILQICLLSAICTSLAASLTDEQIILFMDEKPVEGYAIDPTKHGLEPSSSAFIILNYDDAMIEGFWKILENPDQQKYWKHAFIRLRIIATVDPDVVGLDRIINNAVRIENLDIDSEQKLTVLRSAYGAIARFRNDTAVNFLMQRTEPDFWEGRELEEKIFYDHAPHLNTTHNGVTESITAIAEMGDDQAEKLLSQLSHDKRYAEMPNVLRRLKAAKYYHESAELLIVEIETAYAKRLEIRGEAALSPPLQEGALEVSSASKTAEASHLSKANEAYRIDPNEEPAFGEEVKRSSNWWLWLVGVVVVFGGILIFRSKT